MALDRQYVQKVVYQGLGKVMESAFNSNLGWAHNSEVKLSAMYPFNPEKAKALLDEAGLKAGANGRRFDLRLVYDSTDASRDRLSQVLQAMWGRIGVRVAFEGSTRNVQLKQVFTDWNFDATLQAYSTAGDPALGISRLYVSSAIRKAPFVNASGYSNPDVDRLFEAGVNATEEAERAKNYKEVQTILARDLPVIPIWETALMNVASARVKGKWAWSTGYSFWEEVWVEA
jgi:peptide/nickel transport system substrate-binding protein